MGVGTATLGDITYQSGAIKPYTELPSTPFPFTPSTATVLFTAVQYPVLRVYPAFITAMHVAMLHVVLDRTISIHPDSTGLGVMEDHSPSTVDVRLPPQRAAVE